MTLRHDASELRKHLREGGWDLLARGLPAYLEQAGLPAERTRVDGTVMCFRQGPTSGISAWVEGDDGQPVCVATSEALLVPRPEGPKRADPSVPITIRTRRSTVRRIDRYLPGTGHTRSSLVAHAVELFLRSRGM